MTCILVVVITEDVQVLSTLIVATSSTCYRRERLLILGERGAIGCRKRYAIHVREVVV